MFLCVHALRDGSRGRIAELECAAIHKAKVPSLCKSLIISFVWPSQP